MLRLPIRLIEGEYNGNANYLLKDTFSFYFSRSFDSASNNRRPSKPDLPLTERVGFPFTVEANGVDNVKYPQTRRFSSLDATNKAW